MNDADRIAALTALVEVLNTGMKIAHGHFVNKMPEPHHGATAGVMTASLGAVSLARASGLIPQKADR